MERTRGGPNGINFKSHPPPLTFNVLFLRYQGYADEVRVDSKNPEAQSRTPTIAERAGV